MRAPSWFRRFAESTLVTSLATHFMLVRYLAVGSFVGAMDLGTMKLLIVSGVPVLVAATISYLVMGVGLHFTVNKLVTFRNLERSTLDVQMRNYAIVTGICYLTTIAIVEAFHRAGVDPTYGKAAAIVANVPLAFFCNKTFTFVARERGAAAAPAAPAEGGTRRPGART